MARPRGGVGPGTGDRRRFTRDRRNAGSPVRHRRARAGPELPGGRQTLICGGLARVRLEERISGRTVVCEERDRDRYGRIVAVCRAGGEDLNAWMVSEGWALAYRRYSEAYVEEEAGAKAAQQGSGAATSCHRGIGARANACRPPPETPATPWLHSALLRVSRATIAADAASRGTSPAVASASTTSQAGTITTGPGSIRQRRALLLVGSRGEISRMAQITAVTLDMLLEGLNAWSYASTGRGKRLDDLPVRGAFQGAGRQCENLGPALEHVKAASPSASRRTAKVEWIGYQIWCRLRALRKRGRGTSTK